MNFTIKNVSYNKTLSRETPAFSASIYADDVKVGTAINNGHGGNTNIWIDPQHREKVDAWVNSQPPAKYDGVLEDLVDDLFAVWQSNKQLVSWCKTKVVFRLKDTPATAYQMFAKDKSKKYTIADKNYLSKTFGDQLAEIVNETLGEVPV